MFWKYFNAKKSPIFQVHNKIASYIVPIANKFVLTILRSICFSPHNEYVNFNATGRVTLACVRIYFLCCGRQIPTRISVGTQKCCSFKKAQYQVIQTMFLLLNLKFVLKIKCFPYSAVFFCDFAFLCGLFVHKPKQPTTKEAEL